ncbi:MAG TPA: site-2 protease family protein [Candidatus Dormibacteraeota bacterium]|nr:site-2 protease family protein [Candidatus Dormibacteraeota bacterium]
MRLGTLFGIEIIVNSSWLFIFALVVWALASGFVPFQAAGLSPLARGGLAVVTALLFFGSVLAHELAHSLVARTRGVPVSSITLFIFGGVSRLEGEPQNAPGEAWIAFVGPLTSLVLAVLFAAVSQGIGEQHPVGAAFAYLGAANLMLAIFNLLPAAPLDGGRVLHALIWRWTGNRLKATRVAGAVGRVLAWVIIAFGIVNTLATGLGGGLWLMFIGWYLLQAGAAETIGAELDQALRGLHASDLMAPPAAVIPADATAEGAFEQVMRYGGRALPVMLGERLLGLLAMRDMDRLGETPRDSAYATAIMTKLEDLERASPEEDALAVVRRMAVGGYQQLPVIDNGDRLLGLVTRESVLRRIANAEGAAPAA